MSYPVSPNEPDRQAALDLFDILDTAPEPQFDRLTAQAQEQFGAVMAYISLLDRDRQWFKSCIGLSGDEMSRDVAFCAHAILSDEGLVVLDAREDERFARNPLVTGEPFIRFYAGAPLMSFSGYRLGALCVIDPEPRQAFSATERSRLRDLADIAVAEMEARKRRLTGPAAA